MTVSWCTIKKDGRKTQCPSRPPKDHKTPKVRKHAEHAKKMNNNQRSFLDIPPRTIGWSRTDRASGSSENRYSSSSEAIANRSELGDRRRGRQRPSPSPTAFFEKGGISYCVASKRNQNCINKTGFSELPVGFYWISRFNWSTWTGFRGLMSHVEGTTIGRVSLDISIYVIRINRIEISIPLPRFQLSLSSSTEAELLRGGFVAFIPVLVCVFADERRWRATGWDASNGIKWWVASFCLSPAEKLRLLRVGMTTALIVT